MLGVVQKRFVGLGNMSTLILLSIILSFKSKNSKPVPFAISIVKLILPALSIELRYLKNKRREAVP